MAPTPSLDPTRVDRLLHELESSPPFVRDPLGVGAFRASFEHLRDLIGELYAVDPFWFWMVMGGLLALAAGLGLHILWSLWVLYRSVTGSSAPRLKSDFRERSYLDEAHRARGDGLYARAIELIWISLCDSFGVRQSDTPGRQYQTMMTEKNRAQLTELMGLHERALYSSAPTGEREVGRALELLRAVENDA